MKTVDVKKLNERLRGFSEVLRFELAQEIDSSAYNLRVTLANDEGVTLTLICDDVQNLELNPAGNGFEQMLRLEITDMREDGLDRVHYSVEETEHETLFLHCASVDVQKPGA